MSRRPRATIQQLSEAVQSLPRPTRIAMLEGLDAGPIIAGAYTSGDGICPMLAAHRAGGRCDAAFFADAWDQFAFRDERRRRRVARRVNDRELRILRTQLQASLLDEELAEESLREAPHEHREPRPGDRDRAAELRGRAGWAWSRLFRRYDEYEAAIVHLHAAADPRVPDGAAADPRVPDGAAADPGVPDGAETVNT
jgi:hypothetical protein